VYQLCVVKLLYLVIVPGDGDVSSGNGLDDTEDDNEDNDDDDVPIDNEGPSDNDLN